MITILSLYNAQRSLYHICQIKYMFYFYCDIMKLNTKIVQLTVTYMCYVLYVATYVDAKNQSNVLHLL